MAKNRQYLLYPTDVLASTPALAEPLLCKFSLRPCNDQSGIFALQGAFAMQGLGNKEQTLTLLYRIENLQPDTLSLIEPLTVPSAADGIQRGGNPQWMSLTLKTMQLVPILCSFQEGQLKGLHNLNKPLANFVNLAKVTEASILFDFNHLHQDKQTEFKNFLQLNASLPLDDLAKFIPEGGHLADNYQSVFDSIRATNPPSYGKRSGSPSLLPPQTFPSFPDISDHHVHMQQEAIEEAVDKYLPRAARKILVQLLDPIENHIHAIFEKGRDHSEERHRAADAEFLDILEDYKADMTLHRNDCITSLHDEGNESYERFKERIDEVIEEAGDMADLEYVRFLERAPTLVLGQLNQNLSSSAPTRRPPKPLRSASSSRNRSLRIPGLRDKALHVYYLWHCTQVRGADLKQHFKHAYDIAVARGLDPELIARHGDATEYIEKGVLEGVAKRWVGDIRAWVDEVGQET